MTLETTRKKKYQENAILLTITETPLPQLITLSDPAPTLTDLLLETLAIPTPPQIVLQPHITESTTNETTINYSNQEQTIMRTHGFKHHSLPTIESSSEPLSQPTPPTPQQQLPPDVWARMSNSQRKNWRKRNSN